MSERERERERETLFLVLQENFVNGDLFHQTQFWCSETIYKIVYIPELIIDNKNSDILSNCRLFSDALLILFFFSSHAT